MSLFQVERHCNRLDADLVKFEEEAPLGRERITAQPGLAPSARSLLREVARDKVARAYERDRKEGKVDKRGKLIQDMMFIAAINDPLSFFRQYNFQE